LPPGTILQHDRDYLVKVVPEAKYHLEDSLVSIITGRIIGHWSRLVPFKVVEPNEIMW